MFLIFDLMNWGQYGKTFSRGFYSKFSNQSQNKFFTNFTKNLHKNKYVNNFINSNFQFKMFTVTLFNTMNFQTVNFLNNFQFNTMRISSEGFRMLQLEKTQEDISAILSHVQSIISASSVSFLNEIILGLKGKNII